MEDGDPEGDYRTFRANFTAEGLVSLRERVKEKLKEFLGDYTDDTLAEYVIVLLRNGRHKEEARKELNVFLEDDSVSFVSWLWDHLSSNLHLYVHPKESLTDGEPNTSSILEEKSGRSNEKLEHASGNLHADSENGTRRIAKVSSGRRNREWRGLAQDETTTPLLRSTTNENFPSEERTLRRRSPIKRSPSPRHQIHEKRRRQDERQMAKKDVSSKPVLGAPSRLLQFAVRDAVRTAQQAATRSEPALKRLRSVVSASTVDQAPDETYRRTRPVSRVPVGIATAIRAAAEAANDATRVRASRNVFSRLGHVTDEEHVRKESSNFRESMAEDEKYDDFEQNPRSKDWDYVERNEFDGESIIDTVMVNEETGMASDSGSDDDGYNDIEISRPRPVDASQVQSAASVLQDKDALMVQSSVAQHAEEGASKTCAKDQDSPLGAASNPSHKIVNISVNVNTWKPPHYQAQGEITGVSNQTSVEKMETGERKMAINLPAGNNTTVLKNADEATCSGAQKDAQKSSTTTTGSYSTARPSEDAHSRTIFVSNVHFAATKDTLSRHFNKFGEVLKVVIVTDAATGQSKGSAYVEFLRKESAELALSLNGTSFMSRILKVVRSSAHHEAAAMMPWPRSAWTSTYPSRLARIPFPRGIMGGAIRARLPIKPGARSLQWKREAPTNPTTDASKNPQNTQLSGSSLPSPTARSLTYVRSEPKSDANSTRV